MAKISTYDPKPVPSLDDYLIGTDTPNSGKTKNYRVGDLVGLIGGATDYYFNREGTPYTNMTQVLAEVTALNRYPGQVVNIAGVDYYYLGTSYVIKPVYDYWTMRSGSTTVIVNGYLYNWFAVTNASPICASNAHVPTNDEWTTLINSLGGQEVAGGKLKEEGMAHWTNNVAADNTIGFTALPGGSRNYSAYFSSIGSIGSFWSSTPFDDWSSYYHSLYNYSGGITVSSITNQVGLSVRLIVDTPIEISGTHAIYVGNDGLRYNCILINSIWWTAENLAETKYRDESSIPIVTDNTTWSELSTGAMCSYDNDEANVLTTTTNDFEVPVHQVVEFIADDNIALDLVKEDGIIKLTVKQVAGTSEVDHVAVFNDTEGKTLKSTNVTIDDSGQAKFIASPDEDGYCVGLEATGTGTNSYGMVGYSDNIPIQGTSLDTSPTGMRRVAVWQNDNAHTTPENGFGLMEQWRFPNLRGDGLAIPGVELRVIMKDVTNGAENIDIEFWSLRAGTMTKQATITHLGAIVPNP